MAHSQFADMLGPIAAMCPENSTPRISDAPGGRGYWPLRCEISNRFSPKAAIWRELRVMMRRGQVCLELYSYVP
jgi:hypothetical protein